MRLKLDFFEDILFLSLDTSCIMVHILQVSRTLQFINSKNTRNNKIGKVNLMFPVIVSK